MARVRIAWPAPSISYDMFGTEHDGNAVVALPNLGKDPGGCYHLRKSRFLGYGIPSES